MRPATIEGFPGLDLRTDPADSNGAIDMLNVVLEPGRVRTRPGSTSLYVTPAVPVFAMANQRGPTTHLIAASLGAPGELVALSAAGAVLAASTVADVRANGLSGVAIGTAAADYFYVASPYGASVVKRWDGAAWSSPAGFPAATQVFGHSQTDNRLIACVGSRANFSDPGAPETFGANNYVSLGVGDGEQIHGAAWFNNQAFIFKKTKFFVFYGNSADGQGEPIFNYRTVEGAGIWAYAPQAVCAGPSGVFFLSRDGIYRTTGGPPVKISRALDPFFDASTGPFWPNGNWDSADMGQRLHWHDGKLYAAVMSTTGTRMLLIWEEATNAWTVWSHAARALASLPLTTADGAAMSLVFGSDALYRVNPNPSISTDAGNVIVSRYRSAFNDFGSPLQKMIRETILEGTGSVTLRWSRDWGALTTGSTIALGSTLAVGRQSKALPGRAFSYQIGAASGAWTIHQIQPNMLESSRPASFTV